MSKIIKRMFLATLITAMGVWGVNAQMTKIKPTKNSEFRIDALKQNIEKPIVPENATKKENGNFTEKPASIRINLQ